MSDAWEYKEATWSELDRNPYNYEVRSRFNDRYDEEILEKETKKLAKKQYIVQHEKQMELTGKGPRAGKKKVEVTYYYVIELKLKKPSYLPNHMGYILDDNGYPINRENFVSDFPKPPVSLDDASDQLEKIYSEFYWDFPTWLGHHSREGWEIFKISRNFKSESHGKVTWCVFRRRV